MKYLLRKTDELFFLMKTGFVLDEVVLDVELLLELVEDVEPNRE